MIADTDQFDCVDQSQLRSSSTIRMRRLRERRHSNTRIVTVEVTAADCAYLRLKGFVREGENAGQHLTRALQRLLQSIR
jgi:hypothetical protein